MNNKCVGCGSIKQSNDKNKEGYTTDVLNPLCQRCFKIKNYGEYTFANKDSKEYEIIFNNIKKSKDLVLYLCDILNLDESLNEINNFNGNVILVITKKDLLPKSVKEHKIIDYIKNNYNIKTLDIIFVSSVKNYNLDLLMKKIEKNKTSNKVYLVGNTNAGKSTLINRIIKSYTDKNYEITTSGMPATTLDLISIKISNDLTLIDTPGIVNDKNYLTSVEPKIVKKLTVKSEIKPRTFQLKKGQSLLIDEYARIDYLDGDKNSFTIYVSNDVDVSRINQITNKRLLHLNKHSFTLEEKKDVVISGLLFCKIVGRAKIDLYVKDKVNVFKRDNLI